MLTDLYPKITREFYCEFCNYKCSKNSVFNKHLGTHKHRILTNPKAKITLEKLYVCGCNKKYKHASSLSLHKKKCLYKVEEGENTITKNKEPVIDFKIMLLQVMEENKDLRKTIANLLPIIGSNNNSNNINQKFNINIFLHEQCKDAISLDQFVEKIEISMKNLLTTKDKGLGIGLSSIIIENMNKLSLYERPMHCTDKKRETIYIKNIVEGTTESKWKKDENNQKLSDLLKRVAHKQNQNMDQWVDEHPNFMDSDKLQDEYHYLIKNCTNSPDDYTDKVIKKVCENLYIT